MQFCFTYDRCDVQCCEGMSNSETLYVNAYTVCCRDGIRFDFRYFVKFIITVMWSLPVEWFSM